MDRVLIAVDGEEQAGPATAYLIDRVHETRELEIVVLTVRVARRPVTPDTASAPYPLRWSAAQRNRKPRSSVEGARPWLDEAGIRYQFLCETGDLPDVVNRMVREQDFTEVVVVSQNAHAEHPLLTPLMGGKRLVALSRLQTPRRTRLSVVSAKRPPRPRT